MKYRPSCITAHEMRTGDPNVVGTTAIFANLEPRDTSLDFGHRCGAPMSSVSPLATLGTPLTTGDTAWLPLYLSISPQLYMKSVSAVVTYATSKLRVIAVRSPDEAPDASTGGSAGFYDSFTLKDAMFTVNYGDTNAVTVTLVWPEPQQLPRQVSVIALLYVEVLISRSQLQPAHRHCFDPALYLLFLYCILSCPLFPDIALIMHCSSYCSAQLCSRCVCAPGSCSNHHRAATHHKPPQHQILQHSVC